MLCLILATSILALSFGLSNGRAYQLPKAKAPFEVGTANFELTDRSRLDPFAPTPQSRSVQISLHYPITPNSSNLQFATYLPFLTANATETAIAIPSGTLQNISTHSRLNAPILNGDQRAPVILFSPGLGVSRLLYTTFVEDLASEGYAVVSIDHPHDASIAELSDGRVITANISGTPAALDLALAVRVADARFILDELANGINFTIIGLNKGGLDTSRVGFFGHSLGGATVATAMVLDERVVCGVNMDGGFQGSDIERGFAKPFVIMASEGHNRTTVPSWGKVWPKLRGFKRETEVKGSLHMTYTDGPVVANLLGLELEANFGTIGAQRFDKIQHAYLTEFFEVSLRGKVGKENLLEGASEEFPEVLFAPQI